MAVKANVESVQVRANMKENIIEKEKVIINF